MSAGAARNDAGETLVEVLVTIAILGITFVGVLSGLGTAAIGSNVHRKEATSEVVLRDVAEVVVDSALPYVPCATTASYPLSGVNVPAGYQASVVAVAFWDGKSPAGFASTAPKTCPAADSGVERLSLQVRSNDDRAVETLDVYKRRP